MPSHMGHKAAGWLGKDLQAQTAANSGFRHCYSQKSSPQTQAMYSTPPKILESLILEIYPAALGI